MARQINDHCGQKVPASARRNSVSHRYAPNSVQVSRNAGKVAIGESSPCPGRLAHGRLVQAGGLSLPRHLV